MRREGGRRGGKEGGREGQTVVREHKGREKEKEEGGLVREGGRISEGGLVREGGREGKREVLQYLSALHLLGTFDPTRGCDVVLDTDVEEDGGILQRVTAAGEVDVPVAWWRGRRRRRR